MLQSPNDERVEYTLKVVILLGEIFEIPDESIPAPVSTTRIRNVTSLYFRWGDNGMPLDRD